MCSVSQKSSAIAAAAIPATNATLECGAVAAAPEGSGAPAGVAEPVVFETSAVHARAN